MTDDQVHADLSVEDLRYVERSFRPVDQEAQALIDACVLPQPTYVLADGTGMVPQDHAQLLRDAEDQPAAVAPAFRRRFIAAGGDPDDVDDELAAWLSGEYGACLWTTSPEAIVAKGGLMATITALLTRPTPADAAWRHALRGAVDALDALERPFTDYDRIRFGGPVSRDRLVTTPRETYPEVWADQPVMASH